MKYFIKNREELFPFFKTGYTYLNSGSESLRLQSVIDFSNNYDKTNGLVFNGTSFNSEDAQINEVREQIVKFTNAKKHDVVFTSNTTESINIIASVIVEKLNVGDEILVTDLDHVSNIAPWKSQGSHKGIKVRMLETNNEGFVSLDEYKKNINENTKVVSLPHLTNTFSTPYNIKEIISYLKSKEIIVIVDGAQAAGKVIIDVDHLGADFYVISTHKMFSLPGGILIGNSEILENGNPYMVGGKMHDGLNEDLSLNYRKSPERYESGTKNISSILSISKSIEFINSIDLEEAQKYLIELKDYATKKLLEIDNVQIINEGKSVGNLLFNIKGYNHEDIRRHLESEKIIVRSGFVCSNNINPKFEGQGFVRVTINIYNDTNDIDKLVSAIKNGGDFLGSIF